MIARLRRVRDLLTTTAGQRRHLRAAVARLNWARPGWHRELNLGRLDLHSATWCVLGQLYGGYWRGRRELYGLGAHVATDVRAFDTTFPRRLWATEVRVRLAAERGAELAEVAA